MHIDKQQKRRDNALNIWFYGCLGSSCGARTAAPVSLSVSLLYPENVRLRMIRNTNLLSLDDDVLH